jgi:hypothetical protein
MNDFVSSWHSYPKVYNVGHPAVSDILKGYVVIQEKVDGSQFSFGVHNGEIKMRTRKREFCMGAQDKMFELAAEQVQHMAPFLSIGHTYRCEYLNKPKHNTICYDRVPQNNLVLFDVEESNSSFFDRDLLEREAECLGIDVIPSFYFGPGEDVTIKMIQEFLNRESFLGGSKVEGVVIKNYSRFGRDGKVMMGKHVSEKFKEANGANWKKANPSNSDVTELLVTRYKTDARWEKAVQHLRDDGRLENSPRDIGELIKEVQADVKEECEEEIKQLLFNQVWPKINRGLTRGFPEWYKERLLKGQFDE